jgi:hypothetical protein
MSLQKKMEHVSALINVGRGIRIEDAIRVAHKFAIENTLHELRQLSTNPGSIIYYTGFKLETRIEELELELRNLK